MLTRIIAATTLVSAALLAVLLFTTTPSTTGPLGILGFFVLLYLTALGVLTFLFWGLSLAASKLIAGKRNKFVTKDITLRGSYYYASVIASVPVMLIAIQSVGQLGVYQALLVLFFVAVAIIYVKNRT